MRYEIPDQAIKLRALAAKMRHDAGDTMLPVYRRKFEITALDLEAQADRLERKARFRSAHSLAG